MAELLGILKQPILIGDGDDRVVKVHCGTPDERCNLDDAAFKQSVSWQLALAGIVLEVLRAGEGEKRDTIDELMCNYCFGREGEE